MFWLLNKTTNTPGIFGSVKALCENTGLKDEALYYQFSRLKKNEFENENYRIAKCSVVRKLSKK